MQATYNPFQRQELYLPSDARQAVDKYCQTTQASGERSPLKQPFRRVIDFWVAAVVLGARETERSGRSIPQLDRSNGWHFIDGVIFEGAPDRIELLELIAIAFKSDPFVIDDPAEIITIANGLSSVGYPKLLLMLEPTGSNALDPILDAFETELQVAGFVQTPDESGESDG
jgi:hypothetical protein